MSSKTMRARPQSPAAAPVQAPPYPAWLSPAVVAAAVFLAYANVFQNTFLYGDDETYILRNAYLQSWRYLPALLSRQILAGSGVPSNFFRPLQMLLYFLAVHLFGVRPWPFQLLNVGLHATAAVLLFFLIKQLARLKDPAAAALSLLWALHPIQVEAVANINGTADPLAVCGMLAAFWLFLRERRGWSVACFVAALASKESALMLPPLLLAYDLVLAREKLAFKRHAPYWLAAAVFWCLRVAAMRGTLSLDFYPQANPFTEHLSYRFFTLLTALGEGLRLLAWPTGLHAERNWPVFTSLTQTPVMGSALALAVLLLLAYRWRAARPVACFGILWFFISYVPMSNLLAKINALFCEHWFYLPSLGLIFVAADLFSRLPAFPRKATLWAFIPLLALLAGRTLAQTAVWRDPLHFDAAVLSYEPGSAKSWNNFAMALSAENRTRDAVAAYQRAIALSDTYPQTRYNLGNCYRDLGDLQDALVQYRRAIDIDPDFYFAHVALGDLLIRGGDRAEGIAELKEALILYPEQPEVRRYLEQIQGAGH